MTTTPNSPKELLEQQEQNNELDFQRVAAEALVHCTPKETAELAGVILETLRDWHVHESKTAENSTAWLVDATRLDLALKTLNLVRWD